MARRLRAAHGVAENLNAPYGLALSATGVRANQDALVWFE